jgi:hypothetical protein
MTTLPARSRAMPPATSFHGLPARELHRWWPVASNAATSRSIAPAEVSGPAPRSSVCWNAPSAKIVPLASTASRLIFSLPSPAIGVTHCTAPVADSLTSAASS